MVFRRVVAEKRLSEPERLPLPVVTVAQKIVEVEVWLRAHGKTTLEDILRTADSRFAVVVTFLAVLELWHQSRVSIQQEELFGPITIVPGPRFGQRIEVTSADGEMPAVEGAEADALDAPDEERPSRTARRPRRARADSTDVASNE